MRVMRNLFEGDALEKVAELSFAPPRPILRAALILGLLSTIRPFALAAFGLAQLAYRPWSDKGDAPLKSGIETAKAKRGEQAGT